MAQPFDTSPLVDPFQRKISYLRLSVTDRCDFRCVYCMSEQMTFLPKPELLSIAELDRLCTSFIELGITKLRITGGEPLVRRDIMTLFRGMSRHLQTGALTELTLTTNGSQLAKYSHVLADCGVRRINVSLDTLSPSGFAAATRWGRLEQVLEGIAAAKAAGLAVRINAVALRGNSVDEIHDLVAWCGAEGFDLAFIEVMPMGGISGRRRLAQYWSLRDLRQALERRWTLSDCPDERDANRGPARYARVAETGRRIGFISPISGNFCTSCNRVRVTCTGRIYMCLGQDNAADLREVLRAHPHDDRPLKQQIRAAIARKPLRHDFGYNSRGIEGQIARPMSQTGG